MPDGSYWGYLMQDDGAIGHGGILDRFDSLLFAAPFMVGYLTIVFLIAG